MPEILVVEDEKDIADLLKDFLTNLGYGVEAVSSAKEALGKLLHDVHRFSLVMTDYRLPETDGLRLVKSIRHIGLPVSIILMSGNDFPDALPGVDNVLRKPFRLAQIQKTVAEALSPG